MRLKKKKTCWVSCRQSLHSLSKHLLGREPKVMGEDEEERTRKSWPVGALALAEAIGPTSGDSRCFREHEGEEPRGGSMQWKLPGGEARQGFPAALAPQSCSHPHTHLFQGVCCSFNDLREMFVIFSDNVLQHVCRRANVGKAPGLSGGHGAAAPRSALLRGAESRPRTAHMEPSARA